MNLWLSIAVAAVATLALFGACGMLVARGLRLRGVNAQLAETLLRLSLALVAAVVIAASRTEHRVALVFTVGATYFAAAIGDGVVKYRKRGATECLTR